MKMKEFGPKGEVASLAPLLGSATGSDRWQNILGLVNIAVSCDFSEKKIR